MFILNAYFCRELKFVATLRSKLRFLLRNTGVDSDVTQKGWLPIAKLKPLVERYSCHPMRSLDTSNNLSVGPSCM